MLFPRAFVVYWFLHK